MYLALECVCGTLCASVAIIMLTLYTWVTGARCLTFVLAWQAGVCLAVCFRQHSWPIDALLGPDLACAITAVPESGVYVVFVQRTERTGSPAALLQCRTLCLVVQARGLCRYAVQPVHGQGSQTITIIYSTTGLTCENSVVLDIPCFPPFLYPIVFAIVNCVLPNVHAGARLPRVHCAPGAHRLAACGAGAAHTRLLARLPHHAPWVHLVGGPGFKPCRARLRGFWFCCWGAPGVCCVVACAVLHCWPLQRLRQWCPGDALPRSQPLQRPHVHLCHISNFCVIYLHEVACHGTSHQPRCCGCSVAAQHLNHRRILCLST